MLALKYLPLPHWCVHCDLLDLVLGIVLCRLFSSGVPLDDPDVPRLILCPIVVVELSTTVSAAVLCLILVGHRCAVAAGIWTKSRSSNSLCMTAPALLPCTSGCTAHVLRDFACIAASRFVVLIAVSSPEQPLTERRDQAGQQIGMSHEGRGFSNVISQVVAFACQMPRRFGVLNAGGAQRPTSERPQIV